MSQLKHINTIHNKSTTVSKNEIVRNPYHSTRHNQPIYIVKKRKGKYKNPEDKVTKIKLKKMKAWFRNMKDWLIDNMKDSSPCC